MPALIPVQLWAGRNRQNGRSKVCFSGPSTTPKQMWTRPSGEDRVGRLGGIQIRRWPMTTILSPRASVSMRSATMQSRFEQHSLGYQECAPAGMAWAVTNNAVNTNMRGQFMVFSASLFFAIWRQGFSAARGGNGGPRLASIWL